MADTSSLPPSEGIDPVPPPGSFPPPPSVADAPMDSAFRAAGSPVPSGDPWGYPPPSTAAYSTAAAYPPPSGFGYPALGGGYPPPGPSGYPPPYGYGVASRTTDQSGKNVQAVVAWVLTVLTLGYFLPWAIAATRGKANSAAVGVLNFLLGWTVVGWIAALVMACGAHQVVPVAPNMFVQQNVAVQFPNPYLPPQGPFPTSPPPPPYGYQGPTPQGQFPPPPYGPTGR